MTSQNNASILSPSLRRLLPSGVRSAGFKIVTQPWVGEVLSFIYRDRFLYRGLRINTKHPLISSRTKAAIFLGTYEMGESLLISEYLPQNCDVVEFGASLGLVSCFIASKLSKEKRGFSVEAHPELKKIAEGHLIYNNFAEVVKVLHYAVCYDPDKKFVQFDISGDSLSGSIARESAGKTVDVPVITLQGLLKSQGIQDGFAFVCDIEGSEIEILKNDIESIKKCSLFVVELHPASYQGENYSVEDMKDIIIRDCGFQLLKRLGDVFAFAPS